MVKGDTRVFRDSEWQRRGRTAIADSAASNPAGFNLQTLDDQFATLDTSTWFVYNRSAYGIEAQNPRIGVWMSTNIQTGTGGSSGATNGTSLRLLTKREATTGISSILGSNHDFTGGMLDTKSAGWTMPRYFRCETRYKIPHGQGLWPAFWFTCAAAGASTAEFDGMEYFHGEVPGKLSIGLWGKTSSTSANLHRYENNVGGRLFFEAPTYTPAWHTMAWEVFPVTSAAGTTAADPSQPSQYVKFITYLNGVAAYTFVDTQATYWTTTGGTADDYWNIYVQGCQIGGSWIGHPDDPLASSTTVASGSSPRCLISGTYPSCNISTGGYSVIRAGAPGSTATLGTTASTMEVDYVKVWKFTG